MQTESVAVGRSRNQQEPTKEKRLRTGEEERASSSSSPDPMYGLHAKKGVRYEEETKGVSFPGPGVRSSEAMLGKGHWGRGINGTSSAREHTALIFTRQSEERDIRVLQMRGKRGVGKGE